MPTLNPQLKISTSCVRDLSNRHEADEDEGKTLTSLVVSDSDYADHLPGASYSYSNTSSTNTKANNTSNESTYDDYLRRKVKELRTHFNKDLLQRNASDTSMLWTFENDRERSGTEPSTKTIKWLNNTSDIMIDPALIPGNLRNARVKSASQIMQEFLRPDSLESTQRDSVGKIADHENSRGDTDFLKVSRIKAKRKPARSSKQEISKQKERINSTVSDVHIKKSSRISTKSVHNTKSGALHPAGEDRISNIHGFRFRNKVNSDISINVPPYLKNSSKDHLSPYQCNASAPRVKNGKRATKSFEYGVRTKPCQGEEQMKPQKVYLTKIQPSAHDVISSEQSSCEQDEQMTCEKDSVWTDIKPQEATRHMRKLEATRHMRKLEATRHMRKLEIRVPQRERTDSEEKKQDEKLPLMMKYELKRKQRREIYALNKEMTDLEKQRFVVFMEDVASGAGNI